jgi:hypothetical protein
LSAGVALAADKILFDFEEADSVNAWSNIDMHALREAEAKAAHAAVLKASPDPSKVPAYKPLPAVAKEPDVKIEWTTESATRGQHAMKLTFSGGRMPTISAPAPLDDWRPYKGFAADVTASRTCIVVFRAMAATSKYGTAYVEGCSRWEFAARLSAGKNTVVAPQTHGAESGPDKVWKNVQTFQIYMLQPTDGEVITIDNIRLLETKPKTTSAYNEDTQWPKEGFRVAGSELVVKNADDLGERLKLKETWRKPEARTVEQWEADIRRQFDEIKKSHPRAVLAMLRQGQKGYDPAHPDREFTGWQCGYGPTHLPMALAMACSTNAGKVDDCEACPRSRPSYHRVDLSSIPKGSRVLAARLMMVRSLVLEGPPWDNWRTKPTLIVTEPVNRPWKEYEVTVFEYAKDKFWTDFAAQCWGEDGDCAPVYLSYGPGSGKVNSWDFTYAVRYWTEGKHANHGFIISSAPAYLDALRVFTYRCKELQNRPCVAVIYEPK